MNKIQRQLGFRFIGAALCFLAPACGGDESSDTTAAASADATGDATTLTATFTSIKAGIIEPRCVTCHGSGSKNGDFTTYAGLMLKVTASEPESSLLYTKVENDSMPRSGRKLNATEKALISDWITAGALED